MWPLQALYRGLECQEEDPVILEHRLFITSKKYCPGSLLPREGLLGAQGSH